MHIPRDRAGTGTGLLDLNDGAVMDQRGQLVVNLDRRLIALEVGPADLRAGAPSFASFQDEASQAAGNFALLFLIVA